MLVWVTPSSIINCYFLCFLCLKEESWTYTSLLPGPPRAYSGSHHCSVLTPLLLTSVVYKLDCVMLRCIAVALINVKGEQYW